MRNPKKPTKPIKTLIVTDYMGSEGWEPEAEAEDIARLFREMYGIELSYTHMIAVPPEAELENYRLLVIDYGGILPGAADMQTWQVRAICEWAEKHPSRLALIWTSFTSRVWKWELEEEFKDLANLLHWEPVTDAGYRMLHDLDEETAHQEQVANIIKAILQE